MSGRGLGLRPALGRLLREQDGGPTVGFVIVALALFGFLIFALQVGLVHFVSLSASDAARRTARLAATLPVAHCAALRGEDGRRVHARASGAAPGARACLAQPSPCAPLEGRWTCAVGAGAASDPQCDADLLARLRAEAQAPGLRLAGLSVSYRDSRLGEAGGPVTPMVSVTLRPAPLDLQSLVFGAPAGPGPVTATAIGRPVADAEQEAPTC